MNKDIMIFYAKIVFRLPNASIRYFEIFFNTDWHFEFINAIHQSIKYKFWSLSSPAEGDGVLPDVLQKKTITVLQDQACEDQVPVANRQMHLCVSHPDEGTSCQVICIYVKQGGGTAASQPRVKWSTFLRQVNIILKNSICM